MGVRDWFRTAKEREAVQLKRIKERLDELNYDELLAIAQATPSQRWEIEKKDWDGKGNTRNLDDKCTEEPSQSYITTRWQDRFGGGVYVVWAHKFRVDGVMVTGRRVVATHTIHGEAVVPDDLKKPGTNAGGKDPFEKLIGKVADNATIDGPTATAIVSGVLSQRLGVPVGAAQNPLDQVRADAARKAMQEGRHKEAESILRGRSIEDEDDRERRKRRMDLLEEEHTVALIESLRSKKGGGGGSEKAEEIKAWGEVADKVGRRLERGVGRALGDEVTDDDMEEEDEEDRDNRKRRRAPTRYTCSNCKGVIAKGSPTCGHCGSRLRWAGDEPPPPPPPPPMVPMGAAPGEVTTPPPGPWMPAGPQGPPQGAPPGTPTPPASGGIAPPSTSPPTAQDVRLTCLVCAHEVTGTGVTDADMFAASYVQDHVAGTHSVQFRALQLKLAEAIKQSVEKRMGPGQTQDLMRTTMGEVVARTVAPVGQLPQAASTPAPPTPPQEEPRQPPPGAPEVGPPLGDEETEDDLPPTETEAPETTPVAPTGLSKDQEEFLFKAIPYVFMGRIRVWLGQEPPRRFKVLKALRDVGVGPEPSAQHDVQYLAEQVEKGKRPPSAFVKSYRAAQGGFTETLAPYKAEVDKLLKTYGGYVDEFLAIRESLITARLSKFRKAHPEASKEDLIAVQRGAKLLPCLRLFESAKGQEWWAAYCAEWAQYAQTHYPHLTGEVPIPTETEKHDADTKA